MGVYQGFFRFVLCGVSVSIGLLTAWQAVAERSALAALPMPGRLVPTATGPLHLDCRGFGAPAVIFVSGAGDNALGWGPVAAALSSTHRVCTYDRPGTGWSPSRPGRADASSVTDDLTALLSNAGEHPPFVIVGHSLGGLFAQAYAVRNRTAVAGLVLVESSEPRMFVGAGPLAREGDLMLSAFDVVLTSMGVDRLLASTDADGRYLPADRAPAAILDLRAAASARGFAEIVNFSLSARGLAKSDGLLPLLPVVVVSRAMPLHPSAGALAWRAAQDRLARVSRVSVHWIARGTGHRPQLDEPALVIAAIEWVLAHRHGATAAMSR